MEMRPVKTLVENRTLYESYQADLSIYDTYEAAKNVRLDSEEFLYCAMITGKKELHDDNSFNTPFLPHESFIMAPGQAIEIDFPEATPNSPTTCLALSIRTEDVFKVVDRLNQISPYVLESEQWNVSTESFLLTMHNEATEQLLARIVSSFVGKDQDRDLVLNFGVTELIARMVRHTGNQKFLELVKQDPTKTAMTAVINYIECNLGDPITVEQLCGVACMSRTKLYEQFKALAACSPMEYVMVRRLERAKSLLAEGKQVTHVCYAVGFTNPSHFSRRFSAFFGTAPVNYIGRRQS